MLVRYARQVRRDQRAPVRHIVAQHAALGVAQARRIRHVHQLVFRQLFRLDQVIEERLGVVPQVLEHLPGAVIVVFVSLRHEVLPGKPIDGMIAHQHAREGPARGRCQKRLVLFGEIESLLHVPPALIGQRRLRHIEEAAQAPVHDARAARHRRGAIDQQLLALHRITEPPAHTVVLHVLAIVLRVGADVCPDGLPRRMP